jgi:hypothetical protein
MDLRRAPSKSARMRRRIVTALSAALVCISGCGNGAADVAVPSRCDASVNARLAQLVAEHHAGAVDNVMVCGTTIGPSRSRHGPRRQHELIALRAPLTGGSALIEVVTNDDLDGRVTAPSGAHVMAYGQYFLTNERQRPLVAGIHQTHCATHRGANNGWVVVNGTHYPQHRC